MHGLAEIVAGILVLGAGGSAVVAAIFTRRLRNALRLVPGRPTPAPTWWLVHPGRAAQLHRRLRRACRTVTGAVGLPTRTLHPSRRRQPGSPLARVGAEVVDRAVHLDQRLVAADRLAPGWRRTTLHQLATEVRAVEAAAVRVWSLDNVWRERAQLGADHLLGEPSLETRLDAMESAMADLDVRPPTL